MKHRLGDYIDKNAELLAKLELAKQRPSSLSVHSGVHEENTLSSS